MSILRCVYFAFGLWHFYCYCLHAGLRIALPRAFCVLPLCMTHARTRTLFTPFATPHILRFPLPFACLLPAFLVPCTPARVWFPYTTTTCHTCLLHIPTTCLTLFFIYSSMTFADRTGHAACLYGCPVDLWFFRLPLPCTYVCFLTYGRVWFRIALLLVPFGYPLLRLRCVRVRHLPHYHWFTTTTIVALYLRLCTYLQFGSIPLYLLTHLLFYYFPLPTQLDPTYRIACTYLPLYTYLYTYMYLPLLPTTIRPCAGSLHGSRGSFLLYAPRQQHTRRFGFASALLVHMPATRFPCAADAARTHTCLRFTHHALRCTHAQFTGACPLPLPAPYATPPAIITCHGSVLPFACRFFTTTRYRRMPHLTLPLPAYYLRNNAQFFTGLRTCVAPFFTTTPHCLAHTRLPVTLPATFYLYAFMVLQTYLSVYHRCGSSFFTHTARITFAVPSHLTIVVTCFFPWHLQAFLWCLYRWPRTRTTFTFAEHTHSLPYYLHTHFGLYPLPVTFPATHHIPLHLDYCCWLVLAVHYTCTLPHTRTLPTRGLPPGCIWFCPLPQQHATRRLKFTMPACAREKDAAAFYAARAATLFYYCHILPCTTFTTYALTTTTTFPLYYLFPAYCSVPLPFFCPHTYMALFIAYLLRCLTYHFSYLRPHTHIPLQRLRTISCLPRLLTCLHTLYTPLPFLYTFTVPLRFVGSSSFILPLPFAFVRILDCACHACTRFPRQFVVITTLFAFLHTTCLSLLPLPALCTFLPCLPVAGLGWFSFDVAPLPLWFTHTVYTIAFYLPLPCGLPHTSYLTVPYLYHTHTFYCHLLHICLMRFAPFTFLRILRHPMPLPYHCHFGYLRTRGLHLLHTLPFGLVNQRWFLRWLVRHGFARGSFSFVPLPRAGIL